MRNMPNTTFSMCMKKCFSMTIDWLVLLPCNMQFWGVLAAVSVEAIMCSAVYDIYWHGSDDTIEDHSLLSGHLVQRWAGCNVSMGMPLALILAKFFLPYIHQFILSVNTHRSDIYILCVINR